MPRTDHFTDLTVAGNISLSANTTILPAFTPARIANVRIAGESGIPTIQDAIDDLSTGGMVFIPEATWSLTAALSVPSNITLFGAGINKTIIKLADLANVHTLLNSDTTNGNSYIRIHNLTFDFNGSNQTADVHGIRFQKVTDVWISDVELLNAYHHNLNAVVTTAGDETNNRWFLSRIKTSGAGTGTDGDGIRLGRSSSRVNISDIISFDNSHHGVHLVGEEINASNLHCQGNDAVDIMITDVTGFTNVGFNISNFFCGGDTPSAQTGIQIDNVDGANISNGWIRDNAQDGVRTSSVNGATKNIRFSNVHVKDAGRHGWLLQESDTQLNNCSAELCDQMGFEINNATRVIGSNLVSKNNEQGGVAGDGIRISGTSAQIILSDIRCFDDQVTKTQRFGLRIQDTAGDISIENAYLDDNDSSDFSNTSTGSNIRVHRIDTSGEPVTTFTDTDATPSVIDGFVFKTANTSGTTITNLDDGYSGKRITVIIADANTTIDFTGTNLKGNGGGDWSPADGDSMICTFDGTDWYCDISDNTA